MSKKKRSSSGNNTRKTKQQDKKLWLRILVLAMVAIMFLGIIILPLIR